MANVRVIATCKRCDVDGEHYTRKNGSKVSPCVACARAAAVSIATAKADDPDYVDKRRAQYKRYNNSQKGKARLTRAKRQQPKEDDEVPGRVALMMGGFTT